MSGWLVVLAWASSFVVALVLSLLLGLSTFRAAAKGNGLNMMFVCLFPLPFLLWCIAFAKAGHADMLVLAGQLAFCVCVASKVSSACWRTSRTKATDASAAPPLAAAGGKAPAVPAEKDPADA